jgi:hypothetical protein
MAAASPAPDYREMDDMNFFGLLLVLLGVLPVLLIGRDGFRGVPVAGKMSR